MLLIYQNNLDQLVKNALFSMNDKKIVSKYVIMLRKMYFGIDNWEKIPLPFLGEKNEKFVKESLEQMDKIYENRTKDLYSKKKTLNENEISWNQFLNENKNASVAEDKSFSNNTNKSKNFINNFFTKLKID